jgi:hypothetical protein
MGSTTYTATGSLLIAIKSGASAPAVGPPNHTVVMVSDAVMIGWDHEWPDWRGSVSLKDYLEAWDYADLPNLAGTTQYVLGLTFNGAGNVKSYQDGVEETSVATKNLDAGTMISIGNGASGEVPDSTVPWDGETAELIVWDVEIGASDRTTATDDMKGVYLP